jgi:iron complex outermembrane receptor protein
MVSRSSIKKQIILLLVISAYFFENNSFAEDERKSVTLDTLVITAEKTEGPAFKTGDVDTEQTPAFFSLISRDQFEGKMEDLSQVIEKEAGVQVRQSGGLGSFSTVSLRGSSGEQVMVFMDGILLNDASGGGVDLSNISLSDVEAIEIYRGVTPVNFGKASVGGAVNIRTLRSKQGFNSNVDAGYGSFNTRKFAAFVNHKPGKWDYLISGDCLSSDNNFEFLNNNGTEFNEDDDEWEDRNNASFDQNNVLAKFGYDFTEDVRVDVVNQWFSKDQGLPGWRNSRTVSTAFDTRRNIATLKLTANNLGQYGFNTSTRLDYAWKEEIYDDKGGHIGTGGSQHEKYITKRYGANFFLEWLTEFNMASLMIDMQHEEYDPENLLKAEASDEKTRKTLSFGLQDSLMLFQEKLIVTPALRYTFLKDESEQEGASRDNGYFDPQIGVKYRLTDWFTLKTNVAKYVREPSFFELFGDRGFFLGNEELKEEKGVNFDAGFEINRLMSNDWLRRIAFHAVYFQSDVDDLIIRVYNARGVGKSDNISNASIKGWETGMSLDLLKYFRFTANATWQNPENQSKIKDADGKKLAGRFGESYLGRVEANYEGFKVYAEYLSEKDVYYDTPNLLKAKDKEEINAGISWLFRSVLLTLEAKNIRDDHYEDFNGYPMPGRSYFASVKYSF